MFLHLTARTCVRQPRGCRRYRDEPVQALRGGGPSADVPKGEAKRLGRAAAKRERLSRQEREKQVGAHPQQLISSWSTLS